MNILAINNLKFTPIKSNEKQTQTVSMPKLGLTMAKPLSNDTVSFGSSPTTKKLISKAKGRGIPMRDAITVHLDAAKRQPEINNHFIKLFAPITVSKDKPLNPVEVVKGRAKGVLSIWEKAKTREWNTLADVLEQMTDTNGVKCVLRDGSPKGARQALKMLLSDIKSGIILEEVEIKRPQVAKKLKKLEKEQYDYISSEELKKFVKNAEKLMDGRKVDHKEPCYTDCNYSAIHFLFKFPGGKSIELQLMGHDVSVYKSLDDLFFKIIDNKAVEEEFAPIRTLIEALKEEKNAPYLEKFNKYRADSFLFQREKEPVVTAQRGEEYFMPLKYNIPYQEILSPKFYKKLVDEYGIVGNPYDFNNIYKIYKDCRPKADAAREALQSKKDELRARKKK